MNVVEVTRLNMLMDTLVGNPAEYASVLGSFTSSDSAVQECAMILSDVLGNLSLLSLSSEDEGMRLAALDSTAGALQARGGGYDMLVGETLGSAVAKRRLALTGRRIKVVGLLRLIRRLA